MVVLGFAVLWLLFAKSESDRYARTRRVLTMPSRVTLSLTEHFARGALATEEYRMADIEGVSTVIYRAIARSGAVVRVESEPRKGYDVPFFFEKTVQDCIWELPHPPPRGDTSRWYTIAVAQT